MQRSYFSQSSYHGSVNRRGGVAGLGLDFKYRRLKLSPEVRYTKLTRPNRGEITVLCGFTF